MFTSRAFGPYAPLRVTAVASEVYVLPYGMVWYVVAVVSEVYAKPPPIWYGLTWSQFVYVPLLAYGMVWYGPRCFNEPAYEMNLEITC